MTVCTRSGAPLAPRCRSRVSTAELTMRRSQVPAVLKAGCARTSVVIAAHGCARTAIAATSLFSLGAARATGFVLVNIPIGAGMPRGGISHRRYVADVAAREAGCATGCKRICEIVPKLSVTGHGAGWWTGHTTPEPARTIANPASSCLHFMYCSYLVLRARQTRLTGLERGNGTQNCGVPPQGLRGP
jgi:hypothetical protein